VRSSTAWAVAADGNAEPATDGEPFAVPPSGNLAEGALQREADVPALLTA
jgi:hypothetical protein